MKANTEAPRRAAFLDRDGVINLDREYVYRREDFVFVPGALEGARELHRRGFMLIVITNQSGIARGLLDESAYQAVARRRETLLAAGGAGLDGDYHCPHHPDFTGTCECRKPGPLLYRRAAADHGLDLARSWWVGDRERDVVPAKHFGGRGVLIGQPPAVVRDLSAAVDIILDELQ